MTTLSINRKNLNSEEHNHAKKEKETNDEKQNRID